MKKICLVLVLVVSACSGVFAASAERTQFRQYVELTKKSPTNPEGMTVVADEQYRIIYVAMPFTADSSSINEQVINSMRAGMLQAARSYKDDVKIIKNLKISFVYTSVTSDKKVFCIPLSYQDL